VHAKQPGRIEAVADTFAQHAVEALRASGASVDDALLQYLSPLGWEHINLTGDYVWRPDRLPADGWFRPLRMGAKP
jgi:hypothetical protein